MAVTLTAFKDHTTFFTTLLFPFWEQGAVSIKRCRLTSIGIPMLKIRQSRDCLIFNMGIPIPGKDGLFNWDGALMARALIQYIQMSSFQYRKSHSGEKTILRPSYLHNEISYTSMMTSLYWIRTQDTLGNNLAPSITTPHQLIWLLYDVSGVRDVTLWSDYPGRIHTLHQIIEHTGGKTLFRSNWIWGPRALIQYRESHCWDKTVIRPSYLHNGISYTGKMTSLYWIRALVSQQSKSLSEWKLQVWPRE